MGELSPSQILRNNAIEVSMDDSRRTDEILADYIAIGQITLDAQVPDTTLACEADIFCKIDATRYKLYMIGVLALTSAEQRALRGQQA